MNQAASKDHFILSCEHGGNQIPEEWRFCFQSAGANLNTHRGYDIGALAVARDLAALLKVSLYSATISRLLIDLNRSPAHPHRYSEWTRPLSASQRQQIERDYYFPYRHTLEESIHRVLAQGQRVVHLSVHSFTPELNGETRNAEIGLLYDPKRKREKDFCMQLQNQLQLHWPSQRAQTIRVRRNYPYTGIQDGFIPWLRRQFLSTEYLGIEIEFNQAFLERPDGQSEQCATALFNFLQLWHD